MPPLLAAGAATCLVEDAEVERFGFVDARVASLPGLKARTGEIAAAVFGRPPDTLDVIAVTGTNGKTTTTCMTGLLVERAGKRVAVAGNIGPTLLDTLTEALQGNTTRSNATNLLETSVLEVK